MALKKAKTACHRAKLAFTRAGNTLVHAVEHKRLQIEVSQAEAKLQEAYEKLKVEKHKDYAKLITGWSLLNQRTLALQMPKTFMCLQVDTKKFIERVE